MSEIKVTYEPTPNPQSMKFNINQNIAHESVQFSNSGEASRSPLASKIFGFPWAQGVYIGTDFVTITKEDWVDWDVLADPLSGLILEHLNNDMPVLLEAQETNVQDDDSDIVKKIKTVLNEEIRPAVAMDGGDIVFGKYEDHVLHIYMQGACSGCPSSSITLKQGIEARLRELFPEIQEVVAI